MDKDPVKVDRDSPHNYCTDPSRWNPGQMKPEKSAACSFSMNCPCMWNQDGEIGRISSEKTFPFMVLCALMPVTKGRFEECWKQMICLQRLLHLFLPFHSLVVACLKKPGETCSSMSACQMQPTWSIVWRLRNLSLFRPLHLSPLSVETVSMWRRRSASQVDPGQSTGRRHPTGLKSSLHFFSLHTDSFCVLKLHFTSWWFKKHIPPFLFSLTVLLCIGYWLLQLIMRCFRFMVEHDEQQGNRFPF